LVHYPICQPIKQQLQGTLFWISRTKPNCFVPSWQRHITDWSSMQTNIAVSLGSGVFTG
jgi:hypothetical protein